MANRIVLYDNGKNPTLVGTADNQVPTWNNTTQEWTAQAGGGGGSGTVTGVTAGTGLNVGAGPGGTITTSGTLNLANTAVTPASYGTTAAKTASFTVDAQGRLTAASETDIAIAASQITSGTLAVANGGTGASTATANTVFAGPTTGGAAAPSFRALVSDDIPSLPATKITDIPYDVSGEYPGTPDPAEECFHFIAVRACTIKATGSRGYAVVAPSGGAVSFDLQKNGTSFGSIDFANGSVSATVTITSGLDVSVADGDRITIVAPANLYTMETPFWTLKAVVA